MQDIRPTNCERRGFEGCGCTGYCKDTICSRCGCPQTSMAGSMSIVQPGECVCGSEGLDELLRKNDLLVKALQAVEWSKAHDGYFYCPSCEASQHATPGRESKRHEPDCPLARALKEGPSPIVKTGYSKPHQKEEPMAEPDDYEPDDSKIDFTDLLGPEHDRKRGPMSPDELDLTRRWIDVDWQSHDIDREARDLIERLLATCQALSKGPPHVP